MLILASDPGPTRSGFILVRFHDGRFTVVETHWRPFALVSAEDRAWWKARVREAMAATGDRGLVAVEQVLHAYGDTPDGALIDTKDVEASLVTLALEAGAPPEAVKRISAVSWRKDLGIQPPATDDQVAIAVEWMYGAAALAGLDDAAREHAYDALGLAAVAVARMLGRPITMPAAVRQRIYERWQLAKGKNKARKAAKTMAEPVRRVLEQAGAGTLTVADVARLSGMLPPVAIEALKVLSKARGPEAAGARRAMVASGLRKPEPERLQTKPQRARRADASQRGWRGKRGR